MDVYGPANLASPHFRVWDIVKHLVGDRNYADDPEAFERASPLTYVTKDVPPTLILHGSSDEIVPVEDSDQLAAKLKECGVSFLYDRVDGWPHGMDFSAALKARCMHFMKAFLDRYLPITKQSD
jgi:dipeptidyl aminopeptidase/acylaminoacyl peptidase